MTNKEEVQKHSPLPWRIQKSTNGTDYMIVAADDSSVTHTAEYDDMAPTEEDAGLIVKAVNNHQDLVDSLQVLLLGARFALSTPGLIKGRDELKRAVALGRAALERVDKQ